MCLRAGECEKQCNECAGPGVAIRVQQLAPGFVQQVQMRDDRCIARGKCWVKRCKAWSVLLYIVVVYAVYIAVLFQLHVLVRAWIVRSVGAIKLLMTFR
jgi:hypothetical protein